VTDLDSVAGAIGAAQLFGGIAVRASEVNSETEFALEMWGMATPEPIESMAVAHPEAGICLVDHQQRSQLSPAVDMKRIVGIIDHHALQSETIVTDKPIFIDIRPWGSMSTIIAHQFMMLGQKPPKPIAGMMLCAILSDTLNLLGPTTTEWDKSMVALLAAIAEVDDIEKLAAQQFKAKSKQLANLSPNQLVCGDQKEFTIETKGFTAKLAFGVIETTDDAIILDRQAALLEEIDAVRNEKNLDALFIAVVNIVELRSTLLCAGEPEIELAKVAFGGETRENGQVMDLGKRVSRKKEFVPPVSSAVSSGAWAKPTPKRANAATELVVNPDDPHGQILRRPSIRPST